MSNALRRLSIIATFHEGVAEIKANKKLSKTEKEAKLKELEEWKFEQLNKVTDETHKMYRQLREESKVEDDGGSSEDEDDEDYEEESDESEDEYDTEDSFIASEDESI